MDKVLKQDSSKCITPSSEPFRLELTSCPAMYPVILYPCGVGAQGELSTPIISDLFCVPVHFSKHPDSTTRALWQLPADTSSSEAGETWLRNCLYSFANDAFLSYSWDPLTCCKILWNGTGAFTSSPKEVVLRIFIAINIHCPRLVLNLQTLGLNGKHANY
jgi:hypothetical protein